jgi:hypothetical protein
MSILSSKSNSEEDFIELGKLIKEIPWLAKKDYESSLPALLNTYNTEPERVVLKELFRRFTHHENDDRLEANDLLIKIIKEHKFQPNDTVFVATSDGKESDGSQTGLYQIKSLLGRQEADWKERNLLPVLDDSYDRIHLAGMKNIVVFDDFIGSGKTIVNKVRTLKTEMNSRGKKQRNYFVFSFVGMRFGVDYAKKELGIDIYCHTELKKGIVDHPNSEVIRGVVLNMEASLLPKWNKLNISDFSLGYKESEALYQLYMSNCSNNVLPIFWWKYDENKNFRNPMFGRLR